MGAHDMRHLQDTANPIELRFPIQEKDTHVPPQGIVFRDNITGNEGFITASNPEVSGKDLLYALKNSRDQMIVWQRLNGSAMATECIVAGTHVIEGRIQATLKQPVQIPPTPKSALRDSSSQPFPWKH